eukprot:9599180-Alexandrium_andersonii.AAC.1
MNAGNDNPTGRAEGLNVVLAEETATVSCHPRLTGGDPDLTARSIVGIPLAGNDDVRGSGELGLLRPPPLLDADD